MKKGRGEAHPCVPPSEADLCWCCERVAEKPVGGLGHGSGATRLGNRGSRVLTQAIEDLDQALGPEGVAEVGALRFGYGPEHARGPLPTPPPPGEPVSEGLRRRGAPIPRGWRRLPLPYPGSSTGTRLDPLRGFPLMRNNNHEGLVANGTCG